MAFVCTNPVLLRTVNRPSVSRRRGVARKNVSVSPRMGIRAVESYDGSFTLSDEVQSSLTSMLLDAKFCSFVAKHGKRESAEYLGLLFQPVPYSVTTPHGMPREFEKYYKNPDFAICNVPPQFMFKAKCYKPSRLCAIYQLNGAQVSDEQVVPESEWKDLGEAFRNPVKDEGEIENDLTV